MPPNSFVEVSLRRSPPDTTEWIDHAETEVIEVSVLLGATKFLLSFLWAELYSVEALLGLQLL